MQQLERNVDQATNRLLFIACTATKSSAPGKLPALDRYQGPSFKVIHKAQREQMPLPTIIILSALHGFIGTDTLIGDYDQCMTPLRGRELMPVLRQQWSQCVHPLLKDVTDCHVAMGQIHRQAFDEFAAELQHVPCLSYASGGIGTQNGQLRRWIRMIG